MVRLLCGCVRFRIGYLLLISLLCLLCFRGRWLNFGWLCVMVVSVVWKVLFLSLRSVILMVLVLVFLICSWILVRFIFWMM